MKKFLFLLLAAPLFFTGCIEDPCAAVICLNNGEEVNQNGVCFCECLAGFEGTNCQDEVMADPCGNVDCENDGTCVDGTCDCPDGFSGDNCEVQDPCFGIACVNGNYVINDDVCVCECNDGFTGDDCSLEIVANFVAEWDAVDMCEVFYGNEPIPYVATVVEDMMGGYQIINFAAFDASLAFAASIDGNAISVPLSEIMTDDGTYLIEGSGVLSDDGNTITWTYTTTDSAGQIDNCIGTWAKVQ